MNTWTLVKLLETFSIETGVFHSVFFIKIGSETINSTLSCPTVTPSQEGWRWFFFFPVDLQLHLCALWLYSVAPPRRHAPICAAVVLVGWYVCYISDPSLLMLAGGTVKGSHKGRRGAASAHYCGHPRLWWCCGQQWLVSRLLLL